MIAILYVSAAIFAFAFLILVIYLSVTLLEVKRVVGEIKVTIKGMEKNIQGIAAETEDLLKTTNLLASDVQQKVESLNVLFDLINDIGVGLTNVKSTLSRFSFKKKEPETKSWTGIAKDLGKNIMELRKTKK